MKDRPRAQLASVCDGHSLARAQKAYVYKVSTSSTSGVYAIRIEQEHRHRLITSQVTHRKGRARVRLFRVKVKKIGLRPVVLIYTSVMRNTLCKSGRNGGALPR